MCKHCGKEFKNEICCEQFEKEMVETLKCPNCGIEYKTLGRLKNHISKCKGKCVCGNPIIKGKLYCSVDCYNKFMRENEEYRKYITSKANEKSRELGSKGLHWCQLDDEKAKNHHKKWYKAGIKKTKELSSQCKHWTQKDKEKLKIAMEKIHTKEVHEKISIALTGRKLSKEHKANVSKVRIEKGLSRGKNNPMYGKTPKTCYGYKVGKREDIGHFVRSTWEANYARILQHLNIEYEYECETFKLNDDYTYTPDFKIKDTYIEIKGYWYDDSKIKFKLFKSMYPDKKIVIIDSDKYDILKKTYKDKIANWE